MVALPALPSHREEIQTFLDKRRPGQSRHTTQRREPDQVKILSGVFEDEDTNGLRTTGTPISLLIDNVDQRSKDYSNIKESFRPGHADYTYTKKYGLRDYRGGGRSSARETAMRVAAGAIARKVIPGLKITGALVQIGEHKINRDNWDDDEINNNDFFCPDAQAAENWASHSRQGPQRWLIAWCRDRADGHRRATWPWCSRLWQTGSGSGLWPDEHQCRESR